jgi:phosphohistidine phosphatase SixA
MKMSMSAGVAGAVVAIVALGGVSNGARAQTAPLAGIATALAQGGFVLVMRHASSPRQAPTPQTANADNPTLERQLDDAGRNGASAMGDALRALRIPIGEVISSPTYRALETVRYTKLANLRTAAELGDNGQSMQGVTDAQAAWLRTRVTQRPSSGNTLLVTHQPNLARAFPEWGSAIADGETVVLRPNATGDFSVVARITIDAWPRLR